MDQHKGGFPMANEVITGNQTATYFADTGDTITLAAGASLITTGQFSLTTRTNQETDIDLVINGLIDNRGLALPGPFITGAAIYLGQGPLGGISSGSQNSVRIGATGHVVCTNGFAIYTTSPNTTIRNDGLIEGLAGIQTADSGQFIRNDGTINFGLLGIGLSGQSAGALSTVINAGTIRSTVDVDDPLRADSAINLNIDNVKLINSGLIEAGAGIQSFGSNVNVINSGTIAVLDTAVLLYAGDNCSLTNTGTITSSGNRSGNAVHFGYDTNLVLNNSGTIESTTNAVDGGLTRAVNSGTITAAGVGIADWSDESFSLINRGLIVGGYVGVTSFSDYDGQSSVIVNYGTISGQNGTATPGFSIQLEGGVGRITNYGTLIGDVYVDCHRNSITNAGTIDGNVGGFTGPITYVTIGAGIVLGDIVGSLEGDNLIGGAGVDRLFGSEGNDLMNSGGGSDLLNGGTGRDLLTGGAGADMFVFALADDITGFFGSERITDFQSGIDHIDLSAFMPTGQFIGGARFHGIAGEVRYNATTGQLVGDTDGDRVFDWSMVFSNKAALTAADFIF
jgi:hypothetical protein